MSNRKGLLLTIIVIIVGLSITASSYAFWSWAGNNVWSTTSLKTYLNGTFYNSLTTEAKSMIAAYPFNVGGCTSLAIKVTDAVTCTTSLTDSGIVGLTDIVDYGKVASTAGCRNGTTNLSATTYRTNNWLYLSSEWTITPVSSGTTSAIRKTTSTSGVGTTVTTNGSIRPTMYLIEDVYIIGGTGTQTDPYVVKLLT